MGAKEVISSNYTDAQKAAHGWKQPPDQRSALVVGSNRRLANIGCAIAEELEHRNFTVLDPPVGELDVTKTGDWDNFYQSFSAPDTLVLAQAINYMSWIEDQPDDALFDIVDSILTGSMMAVRDFVNNTIELPHRKHIVFIGSMAHRSVLNASAPYCAAKAGLHHFARCAGWELTPKGYRVHIVHPSNVADTPMTEETIRGIMRYRDIDREAAEAYWGAINLMPNWLGKHHVAQVVADLVSGGGWSYTTGTAIELSGGQR